MAKFERPVAEAQDRILAAIVDTALLAEEEGNADLADRIRYEGEWLAKRWRIAKVLGLPGTFKNDDFRAGPYLGKT